MPRGLCLSKVAIFCPPRGNEVRHLGCEIGLASRCGSLLLKRQLRFF
jgi:hypothetical protein